MVDALVFNPSLALDFQDIRQNVIRVPDVMMRLREAQELWDRHSQFALDLTNFIAGDDSYFLSNIRLKSLASAIVQVGLYDRLKKMGHHPRYFFGSINGDSALRVAVGEISFMDLILNSSALAPSKSANITLSSLPVLAGISLSEFGCYEDTGKGVQKTIEIEMDMRRLIQSGILKFNIERIVIVGPGDNLVRPLVAGRSKVKVLDSVEMDPFLSWFWTQIRNEQFAQ